MRDPASNCAVIRMNNPPANALNVPFMKQLTNTIQELEGDNAIRGFVLASNSPKIFSAGLDLLELTRKDLNVNEFWTSLQDLWYGTCSCK